MPNFQQFILEELDEATYPGNIGFEEMVQFWKSAEKEDLKKMDKLLSKPKPNFNDFKDLIRDVIDVDLEQKGKLMDLIGVTEVIKMIWAMPWYKVLLIAAIDDAIFFIKIWPVYAVILGIIIFASLVKSR